MKLPGIKSGSHLWSNAHLALLTAAALILAGSSAIAQSTNLAELRELRVQCMESFSTSQLRLDELRAFVGQQAGRERAAATQLFQLQQGTAAAKRRGDDLKRALAQCTNSLQTAQRGVEQVSASYRAAVETLPTGDPWATDGSAALGDLRRAAAAAPRDTWKYRRFQQASSMFAETLQEWRTARRTMEQAAFDLELRGAPSAFKRISNQFASVSVELKALERQLADREENLGKLTEKSRAWSAAIRELREGEETSRERLAKIRFGFHLVDLKFAAWRLEQSSLGEEGIEALPDAVEKLLSFEPAMTAGGIAHSAPGASPMSMMGLDSMNAAGLRSSDEEAQEDKEEGDAAFRDLLARVDLAQARLSFLSTVLRKESISVQTAVGALEAVEDRATRLAGEAAELSAEQERLRRGLETEQAALARGAETLDLVKKRFASDLKVINGLLKASEERTKALSKGLESGAGRKGK